MPAHREFVTHAARLRRMPLTSSRPAREISWPALAIMRPARLGSDFLRPACDLPDLERDWVFLEVRDCALPLERDCVLVLPAAGFALRLADAARDKRDDAPRLVDRLPALAFRDRLEAPERERPEVERELEDARAVR